ncbi:MAG: hypothetical protein WCV67_17645 [Victivallaceae bacterium]|jgi:hypothetical protein
MSKCEYNLTRHPITLLFPCLDKASLDKIKHSVFKNGGVKDGSIVTLEGKVVQGWEAYSACIEFKLPFVAKEFDESPVKLIVKLLAEHKTQLSKQNRALIGAYLKRFYRSQAKANQSAAGRKVSLISPLRARDVAAEKVQLSPKMISQAEKIIDSGSERLKRLVLDGFISISCGAEIARFDAKRMKEFFYEVNQVESKSSTEASSHYGALDSKKKTKLEEELRSIERIYKEKRQVFNADMRQRLTCADSPEEEAKIKQDIITERKNLQHAQQVRIEQAKQAYEEVRQDNIVKFLTRQKRLTKIYITEVVHKFLSPQTYYLVYMRWDYELGEIKLRAVAEKVIEPSPEGDIYTLSSGRKVHSDDHIAIYNTMSSAELLCQQINEQNFCNEYRVLRANSRPKRLFDFVGKKFMENVEQYIEDNQ